MGSTTSDDDILIIGAGVAGLVLAQGLKHRGIPFRLFERDSGVIANTKSQGYRFRAVDNALAALERTLSPELWHILKDTVPSKGEPKLMLLDAISGKHLRTMPTEGTISWAFDRPWLRTVLSVGIENDIHTGKAFEKYELLEGDRVKVYFGDGSSTVGRMLVAADGVRSRVRRQFLPDFKLLDVERMCIWGRTPLTPDFESRFARPDIMAEHFSAMMDSTDRRRSCLFAPIQWPNDGDLESISRGKLKIAKQRDYMFVAFSTEHAPADVDLSTEEARKKYCLDVIAAKWEPHLRVLLEDLESSYAIDIYSSPPEIPSWSTDSRISFMGDAIHTMAPTGGVGGNTAIEDAGLLCEAISAAYHKGYDAEALETRLKQYEDHMRERAKKSIDNSFNGGKILWEGKDWTEYKPVVD